VTIATSCTDDWDAGYAAAHALSPARQTAHRAILARIVPLPTAFATVKMGDRAVAHGLGVFDRGRLGLFDIVTVPEARRKGAARNLLAGLLDWGARQGAQGAWLSVLADNEKAVPLYEQFGFRELYRYHYRVSAQHDGISGSSRTSVARNV
jgi:ribosomal protein S18 acetylase RimI-like enzyme